MKIPTDSKAKKERSKDRESIFGSVALWSLSSSLVAGSKVS